MPQKHVSQSGQRPPTQESPLPSHSRRQMTTRERLDLERTNLVNMRHHAEYVQDRAITMHAHAEQYPDLKNAMGTDATKMYTMMVLSNINELMASTLKWIDYLEQLHREFQEPK